jgi:hypothetical protein
MRLSSGRRAAAMVVIVAAVSCGRAARAGEESVMPIASPTSLRAGWNRIAGGPRTTCALGTPFAFFVEIGDPRKLMVYFQGGGACWDAATCDPRSKVRMYKPVVGEREPYRTGLLDVANSENPVRDYTKVFVPYCTGDAHLGARTVAFDVPATTSEPAHQFVVHHNGVANAVAALDWVYAHVPSPQTILVTGESAGSIPTPVYAAAVSKHYSRARVVQLGDGSGSYVNATGITTSWHGLQGIRALQALPPLDSATLTYPELYDLAARSSPRITFAQINSANDSTQSFFLRAVDRSAPTVPVLLAQNFAMIKRAVPSFETYTVPGVMHTIIPRAEFYTTSVDGVRLRDWVAALLAGAPACSVSERSAPPSSCVRDVGSSLLAAK